MGCFGHGGRRKMGRRNFSLVVLLGIDFQVCQSLGGRSDRAVVGVGDYARTRGRDILVIILKRWLVGFRH